MSQNGRIAKAGLMIMLLNRIISITLNLQKQYAMKQLKKGTGLKFLQVGL
jgi:hypothetical protein